MLRRKLRIGISVSGSALADRTSRFRSGTVATFLSRVAAQVGEERVDTLPHLLAAAQPAPADADEADQLVAPIDRSDEMVARPADPVVEERLDVRLHRAEQRVVRHQR